MGSGVVCGDHGSSPLMRGKLLRRDHRRDVHGLIPAHSGKTAGCVCGVWPAGAHPRSFGENGGRPHGQRAVRGSSPLMRGKPSINRRERMPVGLIPAHAGKTSSPASPASRPRAHPRSRGENVCPYDWGAAVIGPSPLTRGKHLANRVHELTHGLIPADAGKTSASCACSRTRRAHPRSRGENKYTPSEVGSGAGSSPLTRGKHLGVGRGSRGVGLIPAHAGKTECFPHGMSAPRAHPRSHGENTMIGAVIVTVSGSSSLTRGKLTPPSHAL